MPAIGWAETSSGIAMVVYLFIWGLYTLVMLIITMKIGVKALQFVFITLFLLFMLLAFINATGNTGLLEVAGYVGLIMGLEALYTALAMVMNEIHGKTLLHSDDKVMTTLHTLVKPKNWRQLHKPRQIV